MLPLVYTQMPYAILFWLILLASSTVELLGPARWKGSGEKTNQDQQSSVVLNTSMALGIAFCLLFPLVFPGATLRQPALFVAGVILVLFGMGWRWYAIKELGRYFTSAIIIHKDHAVVQTGPYKAIRHPAYTGILISGIGTGLMMGNILSLLALLVAMFIGLGYRISVEEQALRTSLGPAYEAYMQRTKRLIPFVF